MKKLVKGIFISLGAIALAMSAKLVRPEQNAAKADAPQYQFIEQTNAIDLVQTAFNATAQFNANNYAVQTGDLLAIDLEGYNNYSVFKFGLNGTIVGSGADGVTFASQSEYAGWMAEMKWGYWSFANDGRGIMYVPIANYFEITNITSVNFLLSDNKLESITIHNVFITQSSAARNGTAILDCFDAQGALDSTKVTLVDATASARKSARGFQSNQSLVGSPVIAAPKTHIEITVDDGIVADGGYLAYDMSYNCEWVYFRTALQNKAGASFSAAYDATGKALSKHGQLAYDQLLTQWGWFWCSWNVTGTVLERVQTSTGELSKIILDCDNLPGGAQLVLGNFYYISADQKTVTTLVDFATMSDTDFASRVVVTINDAAASVTRAPKEMKIFFLADSVSDSAKVTTDGYDFELNPVMRNGEQVKFTVGNAQIGLYESTIDYIAHVPWAIINIDGTEVHNDTMEVNQVIVKGETAFSTTYAYDNIAAVLAFLDAGVVKAGFSANSYDDLVAVKALYDALPANIKAMVDACNAYDPTIYNLTNKATVEVEHAQYTRTGNPIEPVVVVKLGEHILSADTEYDIAFANNTAVGTAQVNITFKGVFSGSAQATFEIIPIVYTVTFSANGGTGSMDPVQKNEGETYALPANGFTAPEGQEFKCWKIGTSEYAPGTEITVNGNIQVEAVWKDIPAQPVTQFTVSFSANGGTGSMGSLQVDEGSQYTLPACVFVAPQGQEFAGWKVNGQGDLLAVGAQITITANVQLVAQWKDVVPDTPVNPEPQPEPEVEPTPEPEAPADEPAKKKGCGSSVIAASALVSIVSLLGVALLSIKKKQ